MTSTVRKSDKIILEWSNGYKYLSRTENCQVIVKSPTDFSGAGLVHDLRQNQYYKSTNL